MYRTCSSLTGSSPERRSTSEKCGVKSPPIRSQSRSLQFTPHFIVLGISGLRCEAISAISKSLAKHADRTELYCSRKLVTATCSRTATPRSARLASCQMVGRSRRAKLEFHQNCDRYSQGKLHTCASRVAREDFLGHPSDEVKCLAPA